MLGEQERCGPLTLAAADCRRLNNRDPSTPGVTVEGRESYDDDNGTNDRVPTVCQTLYLELHWHLM